MSATVNNPVVATPVTATPVAAPVAAVKVPRQSVPFKYLVTNDDNLKRELLNVCINDGVDAAAKKWNVSPATVYSVLKAIQAYTPAKRPSYDVDQDKLDKALEMLKAGRRATFVSKELGLATSRVYKIAREAGITLSKGIETQLIPQETLDKIRHGLTNNHSAKALSNETGVSYVKVLDLAEEWGIKLERKGKGLRNLNIQLPL